MLAKDRVTDPEGVSRLTRIRLWWGRQRDQALQRLSKLPYPTIL